MNVKQLRLDVQARRGIGDRALRLRVAKAMEAHRTITRDDALLLVAADAGITISRYVDDQATLDRVRALLQIQAPPSLARSDKPKEITATKGVQVTIGRELKLTDPYLPQRIIREAKLMAERVYPKLYVFENSVREVIVRLMRGAHGESWWDSHVPQKVRDEVGRRKADEKRRPWHGKRGAHNIHYTDIGDLKRIVNSNRDVFGKLFPDLTWFNHIVDVITPSRNVSSHHNPLDDDDVKRVDMNLRDWQKHIGGNRDLIPE